jgi:hypothetical protein
MISVAVASSPLLDPRVRASDSRRSVSNRLSVFALPDRRLFRTLTGRE